MKNLKKLAKTIFTFLFAAIMVATSTTNVQAVNETIQLAKATSTGSYIAGVTFSYKTTVNGDYLYCLNIHKSTAENVQAKLVRNSSYVDGGLVYIMQNGYPYKNITGNKDKDYYITQTAVWWYIDNVHGTTNLGEQFKQYGSDNYDLRKYVKALVNEGMNHRNDPVGSTKASMSISDNVGMTLDGDYYVSDTIKVSGSNVTSYYLNIENAPSGTAIVTDGTTKIYSDKMLLNTKSDFKVKVPVSSVSKSLNMKLTVSANGSSGFTAYEYQPVDTSMQNIAIAIPDVKSLSATTTLKVESTSKVSIIKVDSVTKKAVAGAKLTLKDANGKEITTWVSTTNAHIIKDLPNGTYTIEEIEAPKGYLVNKNVTKFTITDTNKNIEVQFENAPKEVVVNIMKIDQETNAPLAGAVLVVKDANGKEIARFTTTDKAYVLTDLPNGTYTVEEISAPEGYIKSDEVISFTIDDEHLSHQITFINAKEVIVPDTSSVSSIIMVILGIVITGIGIKFIYKNGKKA